MRKIILAAAITASFSAHSNDLCESIYGLAETIMDARQEGVEMPILINSFRETAEESNAPKILELANEMTIAAYESPRYSTERNRQNAVKDFANNWYVQCFRELGA